MNIVKYYRKRLDGRVEVARVRINMRSNWKLTPGGRAYVRHRLPSVAQADREMLRRGWTRTKLRPDPFPSTASPMARAIASLGLTPLDRQPVR